MSGRPPEAVRRLAASGPVTAALGLCAVGLGYGGIGWILLVLSVGWLLPSKTYLSGVAAGLPTIAGAVCLVLTVTAVAHWELSGTGVAAVLLVAVLLASLRTERHRVVGDVDDLLAGGGALAIFAVFAAPFWSATMGHRLALLSFTTDAGNHLQLIRAVMRHNGFVTLLGDVKPELYGGMEDYPPGLSGVVGSVLQAHLGSEPPVGEFVAGATFMLVGLYAVLAWLATLLVLRILRQLRPTAGPAARVLAAAASTGFMLAGYDTQLLRDACYAQVLATAAVLAFCLVMHAEAGRYGPPALALLCITLMDSWYLLAPVLACLALFFLGTRADQRRYSLAAFVAVAPACLFPVLTGPGAKHLSVPGFLFFPENAGVLALALTLGGAMSYVLLKGRTPRSSRVLLPLVTAGLLSATVGIGAYQAATDGAAGYYALKALYSTFVAAGCTTALALGLLTADGRSAVRGSRTALVLTAVVLAGAVPAAALSEPLVRSYVRGLPVAPDQPQELGATFADHPYGVSSQEDAWIVDACSPLRDFVLSKWAYDLSLGWTTRREELLKQVRKLKGNGFVALEAAATSPDVDRLTVYVHRPCHTDDLQRLAQNPKVRVVRVP